MKTWWARVAREPKNYGVWIPTGLVDKKEAIFYITRVRGLDDWGIPRQIVEWLEM